MMKIIVIDKQNNQIIPWQGSKMMLGRHAKNDIQNINPKVSSFHCTIWRKGFSLYLEDLKSTNGTYLNGKKITGQVKLKDKDLIGLGGSKYQYEIRIDKSLQIKFSSSTKKLAFLGFIGCLLLGGLAFIFLNFNLTKSPELKIDNTLSQIEEEYGIKIFPKDEEFKQALTKWVQKIKSEPSFSQICKKRKLYQITIEEIFKKKEINSFFSVIAWVESEYEPQAHNPKTGARGMWQLLSPTAKQYGLLVNNFVDERIDFYKSSLAAASYLRDLVAIFGKDDFLLVLAAYNAGEATILYSLKKIENPVENRNFWFLYKKNLIPFETKNYVLKAVAVLILEKAGLLN